MIYDLHCAETPTGSQTPREKTYIFKIRQDKVPV